MSVSPQGLTSHEVGPWVFEQHLCWLDRKEAIALPTEKNMRVAYAYITRTTASWDIEFRMSQQSFTSQELHEHLLHITKDAKSKGIRILEFIVYRNEQEIWRGLL